MIDTLKYTKDLEAAGLSTKQAETMVGAQFKMISENVATKADLNNLELALRSDLKEFRSEFQSNLKELRSEFILENQKMVNKLGVIVVSSVTVLGVFLGLLIKLL